MEKHIRLANDPAGREVQCASLDTILNYRRISHRLATAGQPDRRQLALLAPSGFETVINLLPATADHALPDEESIVRSLGMDYIHIPVPWTRPTARHLEAFCDCLDAHCGRLVFIHCAANYRVSVFLALYRIRRLGWQHDRALRDMHRIWMPNPVWQRFIDRTLGMERRIARDPQCASRPREIRRRIFYPSPPMG
ncbi:MAG: protein tyrosine phosphatase family protein [Candidatus Eisenbacteria bacterium]